MAVTLRPLFEPTQVPATATVMTTAASFTRIDKMTMVNSDTAASHWCTIYLVPSGFSAGVTNEILIGGNIGKLLLPAESYDVLVAMGHILAPGDAIAAVADVAAKVTLFASGTFMS